MQDVKYQILSIICHMSLLSTTINTATSITNITTGIKVTTVTHNCFKPGLTQKAILGKINKQNTFKTAAQTLFWRYN